MPSGSTPPPPSAFPSSLHAPTLDVRAARRTSRTGNIDFEAALRTGTTVLLKESPDLSLLGADALPTPPRSYSTPGSSNPKSRVKGSGTGRVPHSSAPVNNEREDVPSPITIHPPSSPDTPLSSAGAVDPHSPAPLRPTGYTSTTTSATSASNANSNSRTIPPGLMMQSFSDPYGADAASPSGVYRRSIYRAPGSASSPDLATLVRKAKEKASGGAAAASKADMERRERDLPAPPPMSPEQMKASASRNGRARSSTTTPIKLVKSVSRVEDEQSPDQSPRYGTMTGGQPKSMRQKTGAFLSRMFSSQNTVREPRSRTASSNPYASTPTSPRGGPSSPAPPVPSLPGANLSRRPTQTSIADVFSTRSSSSLQTASPHPDARGLASHSTPHSSNLNSEAEDGASDTQSMYTMTDADGEAHTDNDDASLVLIERSPGAPREFIHTQHARGAPQEYLRTSQSRDRDRGQRTPSPSPERTVRKRTVTGSSTSAQVSALGSTTLKAGKTTTTPPPSALTSRANKRRSMSVGEAELRIAMSHSSSLTPLPAHTHQHVQPATTTTPTPQSAGHTAAKASEDWMSTLKSQLSSLDSVAPVGTMALQDPSTPARRAANAGMPQPQRAYSHDGNALPLGSGSGVGSARVSQSTYRTATTRTSTSASASGDVDDEYDDGDKTASVGASGRAPTVTLHPALSDVGHGSPSPAQRTAGGIGQGMMGTGLLPPRSMSLQTARPRPASVLGAPMAGGKGPGLVSRSTTHLVRTAGTLSSGSEPSLVPGGEERGLPDALLAATKAQQDRASEHSLSRWASSQSLLPRGGSVADDGAPVDLDVLAQERARQCWIEDEEFLPKSKIAEWLGGPGAVPSAALVHWMARFDFSGLRLDHAFRRLCAKLYLKAETQQVDRILVAFARRYWECNRDTLFGTPGVVHAVSYSILLLNTDLHVAEIGTRMSRAQFVRNTLGTIQMQLPGGVNAGGEGGMSVNASTPDLTSDDSSSLRAPGGQQSVRSPKRSGSIASWNSVPKRDRWEREAESLGSSVNGGGSGSGQNTAPQSPTRSGEAGHGGGAVFDKGWELEMEATLKEMYNAIKSQQILQPLGSIAMGRNSSSSLTGGSPLGLKMRPSVRTGADRVATLKRGSIRGFSSLLGAQGSAGSVRDPWGDGRTSPAPSFATSLEGGHLSTAGFGAPTLGFASNLSQTIIREAAQEHEDYGSDDDGRGSGRGEDDEYGADEVEISDEELALLGAPWAKEGMLGRKHYWEAAGKKAKNRNWMDVFVVISKGELSMFTFGDFGGGGGVVGGGNWLENAVPLGVVPLAHSLAHALPPPGYNRQRPHCMVLTLASGGTYFFQAGTEELVTEWTSTCNYWAARTSKEPLAGGVSNMEYGWNRVEDDNTTSSARGQSHSEDNGKGADSDGASVRSGKSARSRFGRMAQAQTVRTSPWNERILVNEWKPPMTSMVPSSHDEEAQVDALRKHVKSLGKELSAHHDLKTPMIALYRPGSALLHKAENNWQRKSQYLMTELVKYKTYVDALQSALALRLKKQGEKALERALAHTSAAERTRSKGPPAPPRKASWRSQTHSLNPESTIEEGEEPPPTPMMGQGPPGQRQARSHQRERAEVGL